MRKARKQHKCYECGRLISKGEQYEYVSGKWGESPESYKTCHRCLDVRVYTEANIPCVCWTHGNMLEDCFMALDEYKHELPGLIFGGLRLLALVRKSKNAINSIS